MQNKYNYSKVFKVFAKNYRKVPLEVFRKNPYKILVSTLLSSRTKDETTLKVSKRLFSKADSFRKLSGLSIKTITRLIYPVGFYKTKAKHLFKLSRIVLSDFNGKVPDNLNDLLKLPGVGRKTANLVLNRAFDIPAISVDTHVHRISNILGWVKTKTPQETEKQLELILPKRYWKDTNRLFVSIGRQYTTSANLKKFLYQNKLMKEKPGS